MSRVTDFSRSHRAVSGPRSEVSHAEGGSSLLLVLWALIFLSATVIAWARWIQQDIQVTGAASLNAEARAMAHSGMAMALHPLVKQQSPQLERELGSQLGYRV